MSKSKKQRGRSAGGWWTSFGADLPRVYSTMFAAPPDQTLGVVRRGRAGCLSVSSSACGRPWHDHVERGGRPGALDKAGAQRQDREPFEDKRHHALAKITDDIGRRRNLQYGDCRGNGTVETRWGSFRNLPPGSKRDAGGLGDSRVLGLSPIIPHVTHAMWHALGPSAGADRRALGLPSIVAALETSSIAMVVQVNGRLRGHITVAVGADENTVRAGGGARRPACERNSSVQPPFAKVIIVPGKLVNIVCVNRTMALPKHAAGRHVGVAAFVVAAVRHRVRVAASGWRASDTLPGILARSLPVAQGSLYRFFSREVRASTQEFGSGRVQLVARRTPLRPSK